MTGWNALFDQARSAFLQQRSFARARGLSVLTCLGRHTLSGLLCASGQQFGDWSAAYRLFERERLRSAVLWRVPLNRVLETLPPAGPVVALIDDVAGSFSFPRFPLLIREPAPHPAPSAPGATD
jgi:hypothetical protein